MSISELYKQIILEHNRAPHHFGTLKNSTHRAEGYNSLCGDRLSMELIVREPKLETMAFAGEACAIAIATASLMSDLVVMNELTSVRRLEQCFRSLLLGPVSSEQHPELKQLALLKELRRYPARIKCALLPWATLMSALGSGATVSTEV